MVPGMPGSGGSSASSSSSSEALKKPLLSSTEDTPLIPKKAGVPELLYDRDAIFALQPHVIDGYLILLGKPEVAKGETCKPGGADLGDLDLQFQALQSGNVLDACFGASSAPSTLPSASAAAAASAGGKERAVKEAKEFLGRLGGGPERAAGEAAGRGRVRRDLCATEGARPGRGGADGAGRRLRAVHLLLHALTGRVVGRRRGLQAKMPRRDQRSLFRARQRGLASLKACY